MKEKLLKIFNCKKITSEYKKFILETSEQLAVPFKTTSQCLECYRDQAAILLRVIAEREAKESEMKYILQPGTDIIVFGQRVNAGTITDKLAAQMCKTQLRKYFIKRP